ncbi:MAG: cytochrome c3 family protein [Methanosarcinales archaeon]|nr:cytochrome c3 family protein [Methanosarcinales archaeon]
MKQTSTRRKPEKVILLLLAVVAIGMFALPSTLAMYSGQHQYVKGENVDCTKCHGATDTMGAELAAGEAHLALTCQSCHGFTNAVSTTPNAATDGTTGHAATTSAISCIDCHIESVGFGTIAIDADGLTVMQELANGAHASLVAATGFADVDDACIGCHTQAITHTGDVASGASTEALTDLSAWTYGNAGK